MREAYIETKQAEAAVLLLFELQQDQDNATSPTLAVSFQFECYIVYGRVSVCACNLVSSMN